ncbi:hypothetical protein FEM48_Zijuj07G0091300 [Ziziphus jujuba var. spinosa]|uniref:EF-hand domain-containing protein n=1 Tax=Ziziphus jujuba var. spinosa TaxID=714518 RepID=A0A978V3R5_ZIZJJ|nr:hypothetical protein FEM48_Zijuj07G0091300 [Ziziphus jujuba var. spinosa]
MADRACSNSSSSLRQLIWDFFQYMDTNHDGRVSFLEFTQFLQQNGYNRVNPNIINNLDTDGDRCLDFYEVLTFYYIVKIAVWERAFHGLNANMVTTSAYFDAGVDSVPTNNHSVGDTTGDWLCGFASNIGGGDVLAADL